MINHLAIDASKATKYSVVEFAGRRSVHITEEGSTGSGVWIDASNADEIANLADLLHDAAMVWRAQENPGFGADLDAAKDAA